MLECFSYSEVSKIKQASGCYCWYIDWTQIRRKDFEDDINKRIDLLNAIFKVYTPNPIFVSATRKMQTKTQHFGEYYEGTLEHKENRTNDLNSKIALDYNLFSCFLDFTQSLIIPLYIGKSKNLNRRIKQHIEYLEDTKIVFSSDIEKFEKEELKNFSERFSMIAKDCGYLGLRTNMLSVKLVYMEEDSITEFESKLNYLYKPLIGIK